jgi:hypothetical protein
VFSSCNKQKEINLNSPVIYKDQVTNKIDSIDLYSFKTRCQINTVIPDKTTAIKYAFILLSNVYGENNIRNEFPLNILQKDSNWIITGTLEEGYLGGTAYINIDMKTGTVNEIIHFK